MPPPTPPVTLSTKLDQRTHTQEVVQALRDLARVTNFNHTTLAALNARVASLPIAPSLQQIRQALQASGGVPLNITQLVPANADGSGAVLVGTHADRLILATNALTVGVIYIETDRYAVYEWTETGWLFLGNLLGPMDVTLAPNTKPTDLGINDAGFRIWATDYARLYIWSGTAWGEDNHNPSRYQLGHFTQAPDQNGWFICDGTTISRSTTTGGVTNFTTPDLITANRFLRSTNAGAAGGTGDTSTHHHSVDPPSTVSDGPSITTQVDNNLDIATTLVGNDTHTHNTDIAGFNSGDTQALPPWYNAIPYVRL